MPVPTNSHLQDVMRSYYEDIVTNKGHTQSFGPVTLAQNLVNLDDSGTYIFDDIGKSQHFTVMFECFGPITAGTVTLETSHSPGFTGNWHRLVNRSVTGTSTSFLTVFLTSTSGFGPFTHLRARVTNAIAGGTVNCHLSGAYTSHLL